MQRAWLIIEKTIATVVMLIGIMMLFYWFWALADVSYGQTKYNNSSFEHELLQALLWSYPSILFLLMIPVSGFLLLLRKKYGWLGTIISMPVIAFIIFLGGFNRPAPMYGDGNLESNLDMLYLFFIGIALILLLSKEIRGGYPTELKHWLIYIGIIIFLFINTMVMWLL